MDDVESQAPHGDREIKAARHYPFWLIMVVGLVVIGTVMALGGFLQYGYYGINARYTVAVDSVSGTDPKTCLSFNLTLGIASQNYGSEACINPGRYMEVTYRGAHLAVSVPETRPLCAKPRKAVEQHVLAMATTVPVGNVLDGLVADMKRGVAVFDVTLHLPVGSYGRANAWVPGCKGMRVGQGAVTCESPDQ
ncbi:hypothetical protein VPH35_113931 [Triticum aestivum]